MGRKVPSWRVGAGTRDASYSDQQQQTERKEVVVPLVLWNEAPHVEVSTLHVLYLPVSQPSQNSSAQASSLDATKDNGSSEGDEDTQFQMCVFVGTMDGVVLYWRFEQEQVAQVNMLVFSGGNGMGEPVVGIVSGTDEWGQSTLVSATKDGALARWQLPNGACAEAQAALAKELAPLQGLEMLCNRRFAVVVSEESRLMVLDTWKMQLLYCMDTAQEQIRRSIAVGELQMSRAKSPRPRLVKASSGSRLDESSSGGSGNQQGSTNALESGRAPAASSLAESPNARRASTFLTTSGSSEQSMQRWDALVLSLGAEGLVKCFLWAQPRDSTSGRSFGVSEGGGSAAVPWGFRWVQRSCWVISWADEAEDIICSQSTSLKDGDNMNPQTALMGSIKKSYFPVAVHVSPDSALVLLIWKTKFAVLKRKWLCPLETRSDSHADRDPFTTPRTNVRVGTCRISPAELVRQSSVSSKDLEARSSSVSVCWENGEFLEDGTVTLWTDTGHVFQFVTGGAPADSVGKFFIFTKDHDQLVPWCDSKDLQAIDKALYVVSMKQCTCCYPPNPGRCLQSKPRKAIPTTSSQQRLSGFTSCSKTGTSPAAAMLRLVHICRRGTLGLWTLSGVRAPSPSRMLQHKNAVVVSRVQSSERVHSFSLTDGFKAAAMAIQGEETGDETSPRRPQRRTCLSHLILGRDEAQSSSTYEAVRRAGMRRKRRQDGEAVSTTASGSSSTSIAGTAAAVMASSVLATALAPVTGRSGHSGGVGLVQPEPAVDMERRPDDVATRYLMDVPVIAKGYSDGSVTLDLLCKDHMASSVKPDARKDSEVRLPCHTGPVTALAHCYWTAQETSPSPPINALQLSAPPPEEMHFATPKNPFYRPRFSEPAMKRNSGNRHLDINGDGPNTRIPSRPAATSTADARPSPPNGGATATPIESVSPSIAFMVFSGGKDGVLRVIELSLRRTADTTLQCAATTRQRFRNHRGPIQQISIAPVREENADSSGGDWSSLYPDRLVATVGIDNKVVVYAPQHTHPSDRGALMPASSLQSSCGVEWECVLELSQHAERICDLDWHLERGLLYVECDDRMVYVWSTDTGILERTMPDALLYGGGNASGDRAMDSSTSVEGSAMESATLFIGDAAVELLEFGVLRSAEQIKKNWSSYFYALSQIGGDGSAASGQSPPLSAYATGSMELLMLSLLLSWGATPAIDRSCSDLLGIEPPHSLYSCALQDLTSGALTIPVPWKAPPLSSSSAAGAPSIVPAFARNWQHSSALSANVALGVTSLCMSLMEHKYSKPERSDALATPASPSNKEEFQVLWSQLITQHSVVLPECVPHFREPALEELAAFGFDSCEYTQLAARTLLSGVIKRLPPAERSTLSAEYSAKLHWEMVRLEMETGGSFQGSGGGSGGSSSSSHPSSSSVNTGSMTNSAGNGSGGMTFPVVVARLGSLVLLMSMMGTCFPGEISPAGAREVCDILVFLLRAPERFVASVSAELLTKGLMLFRPHLVDLSSLICQLLLIDVREKQHNAQDEGSEEVTGGPGSSLASFSERGGGGSNAAMSLLVELGACETAFVLGLLQQEMHNHDRPPGFHEGILLYMMELINTHYLLMCRHLPAFVDTVMACLDPTKPDRRRRCLSLSTRCLHNLVRRFPMVDFHKETQRLALGTMEAVIVIYDLRTATKWRVLDGHASAVSAVRFRSDGQMLVSYAARDGSVRWWNSGNAGLFGGMLKMHQSCLKEHKLATLKGGASGGAPVASGGASAGLKQIIQTCRFHFLTRKDSRPGSPGAVGNGSAEQPKHILRLTREDASQVQFLL
ncbi:hypothetical protein BBJ28_00020008 [Nothophytophthora sp. Chile5]|nr:hypothetical protein BBJ28_00020008 [Nothophytophthora sp. Chile5]